MICEKKTVSCENSLFMRNTNVHNMEMWQIWGYGIFFLRMFAEVSFLHILYEFLEVKLNVVKYALNCV